MIIPESYYTAELNIKLTQSDIDAIISELLRTEHHLYELLGYEKDYRI